MRLCETLIQEEVNDLKYWGLGGVAPQRGPRVTAPSVKVWVNI